MARVSIALTDIVIGARARTDLGDLRELAASIKDEIPAPERPELPG